MEAILRDTGPYAVEDLARRGGRDPYGLARGGGDP
jgi:hypothetical protein